MSTELNDRDGAIIFKENGNIEMLMPDYNDGEDVPENILFAISLFLALKEEGFRKLVQPYRDQLEANDETLH